MFYQKFCINWPFTLGGCFQCVCGGGGGRGCMHLHLLGTLRCLTDPYHCMVKILFPSHGKIVLSHGKHIVYHYMVKILFTITW